MKTRVVILSLLWFAATAHAGITLPPSQLARKSTAQTDLQTSSAANFSEVPRGSDGAEAKNPWRAFGMSLLLPGAGEYYAGSKLKAKIFFASEVGFWSALISFRHLGTWRKDDYRLLAATAAGADVNGKDERFFDILGFYDSREEYNKVAGVYDHARPYYPDAKYYSWNWESAAARQEYRQLKNDSKSYYRAANFSLGLILANHFLSAADAYWSAKRFNRRQESGFSGIDLRLLPNGGWQVNLSARF